VKVLLSAFSCAPGWGSEPGIGWGVAAAVAQHHDVWVLTDGSNAPVIESQKQFRPPRLTIEYVDAVASLRKVGTYPHYVAWQRVAFRRAKALHRQIGFDLVHHVTYANSAMPSWLGHLGIPFVWYAGSFSTTPTRFLEGLGPRSMSQEIVRNAVVKVLGQLTQRLTMANGGMAISVDVPPPQVRTRWRQLVLGALQPWEFARLTGLPGRANSDEPFRVLSVGRLLGWKGFHLGLRAFAQLARDAPAAEYWVFGEGPERERLEHLAADLGVGSQVRFAGARPREELFDALAACDVLLHPSIHEQVGFAVLEAMAAARPVICLDAAGPPLLVGATGRVVPVETPGQTVDGLAAALHDLCRDRDETVALGRAAQQRALDVWNWQRIGRDLDQLYSEVVAG